MLKRLHLEVPADRVKEPFVFRMVTKYNLQTNIIEANLGPNRNGTVVLEIEGTPQDIERGILFLRETDIEVKEL
ncbi:MAG: hypothetical protein LDLANPLL_01887 [Turneriella sp.]|nr:hypothetical protein [Turneriella sp.]